MKKFLTLVFILALLSSTFVFAEGESVDSSSMKDSEKLDLILKKLDDIKSELEVVKVRASQR